MSDNYNSATDIVLSELAKLGGPQKSGSTYKLIVCPFHDDSKPSLSVNISKPGFAVGTWNCWSCLHPDELVRSENGLKPIKNIEIGDTVLDFEGNFQKVIAKTKHTPEFPVIGVKIFRISETLNVTKNHNMLVVRKEDIANPKIQKMHASKISVGDYLPLPVQIFKNKIPKYWDTSKFIKTAFTGPKHTRIRITKLPTTPEFMWLYGMYLANGSTYRGVLEIIIHKDKDYEADRIKNCFKQLGLSCIDLNRGLKSLGRKIRVCNTDLVNIFSKAFGTGCENKSIPSWMLQGNKRQLEELYSGINQDGWGNNQIQLTSKSTILDLIYLAAKLRKGIFCKFSKRKNKVLVRGMLKKPVHSFAGFTLKLRKYQSVVYKKISGIDYALFPVEKLLEIKKQPKHVYDITVEGSKTFLTKFAAVCNCPESGNWNKLADKLGLRKIKKWQEKQESTILEVTAEEEQEMLGSKTSKDFAKSLQVEIITDWNPNRIWRGFSGKLIKKLEGKLAINNKDNEPVLLFPVKIAKQTVGYVKALIEKKPGQLSYISSKGPWTRDKGLFPFDYIKKKARVKHYIVLVEGPRDALRLITAGIPALAVFGVQNFSSKKANLVSSIGVDQVYLMSDNDPAGDVLYTKAKESFKKVGIKLIRIKLPKKKDKRGKIIKMDPCNAPEELISKLKRMLKEKHG